MTELNWRDVSKELPEICSDTYGYFVVNVWNRYAATFDIASFDGKNFWIKDEYNGSVNIPVSHWMELSEIPLPKE